MNANQGSRDQPPRLCELVVAAGDGTVLRGEQAVRWLMAREPGREACVVLRRKKKGRFLLYVEERGWLMPFRRLQMHGLSLRENEVMHWVCEGKTNPEIAIILDITTHTVNRHLEHIFEKLLVENRYQAVQVVKAREESS